MSADMYQRPSRDEIAARIKAAPERGKTRSAAENFAVHLSAKMRVLGWTTADLAEKSGLTLHVTGRAVNGNGAELATAEKLAELTGGYLATMIGPYHCGTCAGEPPKGFSCLECRAETRAA